MTKLFIEEHTEVDQVINEFESKEELANILQVVQSNDQQVSPIEVAALHLTMRQVDRENNFPSIERYNDNRFFYPTLALESLKEDVAGKWKAFVAAIKKMGERFVKFVKESFAKFRAKFKKAKSEQKASGEQQANGESVEGEVVEKQTHVEAKKWLVDIGSEANNQTLLKRLDQTAELCVFVQNITNIQAFNNLIRSASVSTEAFGKAVQAGAQGILEHLIDDLGGSVAGTTCKATISENFAVVMELEDHNSYPELSVGSDELVKIELNLDDGYINSLRKLEEKLFGAYESLSKAADDVFSDSDRVATISDDETRYRMMTLNKLFQRRISLITKCCKLVDGITDVSFAFNEAYANK